MEENKEEVKESVQEETPENQGEATQSPIQKAQDAVKALEKQNQVPFLVLSPPLYHQIQFA